MQRKPLPFEIEFHRALVSLASRCEFVLDKEISQLYNAAVEPHGFEAAFHAVNDIIVSRRPKDQFPSVRELITRINPEVSDESQAEEVAARIIGARSRKGYTWSQMHSYAPHASFQEEMKAELGEVGAAIINRLGGWSAFCHQTQDASGMSTVRAQIKRQALSVMERSRKGHLELAPALPPPIDSKRLAANDKPELQRADPRAMLDTFKK